MAAALPGLGLVVDLPIHVLENALRCRVFAFQSKPGGFGSFLFDGGVEFVSRFLGEDLFLDEAVAPEADRVVVGFVALDLVSAAVFFRVGIGDRVPVVCLLYTSDAADE